MPKSSGKTSKSSGSSKKLASKVTKGFLKHRPNSGNPSKSVASKGNIS